MTELHRASDPEYRLVEQHRQLVEGLARKGISDRRVLAALERVPREQFVSTDQRAFAYRDHALAIDCEQTISQPYTVAFMCESLGLRGGERVLEIGTGSGYNAAVLAELAAEVYTIERIPHLAHLAASRLRELGYRNIHLAIGDGTQGWSSAAPFDAIIVTAAATSLPDPYFGQLAEGGRIVIPVGRQDEGQTMCRYTKCRAELMPESFGAFKFVPLIGQHGGSREQPAR